MRSKVLSQMSRTKTEKSYEPSEIAEESKPIFNLR